MKKGIYIIFGEKEDVVGKEYPGIYRKILNQIKTFNSFDLSIEPLFLEYKKSIKNKISLRLPFDIGNRNFSDIKINDVEFIYARRTEINSKLLDFFAEIKKSNENCKIIWEIPTYPYDNEYETNFKNYIIQKKDKFYRQKLHKVVDKIVTFSDDKQIWGIDTINICNGVETSKVLPIKPNFENTVLNMIAVATINYWHGYDRMIEGLGEYKRKHPDKIANIKFHLVGAGDEQTLQSLQNRVKELNLESTVIFYGDLLGDRLNEVYNKCTIGIDALGRHRSGVYFNSSLKGKEYCAKGLPIISGVTTELDYREDFRYYYRVPSDDSPVNIEAAIEFYNNVYTKDRLDVIQEIRLFAENNFDLRGTLKPIVDYINQD